MLIKKPLVMLVLAGFGLLAIIIAIIASTSNDPTEPSDLPVDRIETTQAATVSATVATATASSELIIEDLKTGTGQEVKSGDTVKIHYRGTLTNGTQFDSSYDRNQPFETPIGVGRVIKGWDQGVVGMKVGGKRKLTIPSELGYGQRGAPPVIPPNATLIFELELLGIQ